MWKLAYRDDNTVVKLEKVTTILEASLSHKIPHMWECGGKAECTTCRVQVLDGIGNISPRRGKEATLAKERGWDEYMRLACQCRVRGDVVIRRVVRSAGDVTRMQAEERPANEGQKSTIAVLFCDIRDFTSLTERLMPYDIVHILNRFYARIGEPILYNNGYIFQYVGDEMVAWFGLNGGTSEGNCLNAVRAALGILDILDDLNVRLIEDFDLKMRVSIGIHYGPAIIGNIGHPSKRQLSAVGDTVNLASRVESQNRQLGTSFLVSEEVHNNLAKRLRVGKRATVPLKGKSGKYSLFEIQGFKKPDPILLVQNSFSRIMDNPDRFGDVMYRNIFTAYPEARGMFRGDILLQAKMFMSTVKTVIQSLDRFTEISPGLRELGRRHKKYGVVPAHYPLVMQAFFDTLHDALQDRIDKPTAKAWQSVMQRVVDVMLEGAGEPDSVSLELLKKPKGHKQNLSAK